MEAVGDYIIKMVEKMHRDDIRSVCIKPEVVEEFAAYSDAWMPRSVCASLSFSGFARLKLTRLSRDGRVSKLVQESHNRRQSGEYARPTSVL